MHFVELFRSVAGLCTILCKKLDEIMHLLLIPVYQPSLHISLSTLWSHMRTFGPPGGALRTCSDAGYEIAGIQRALQQPLCGPGPCLVLSTWDFEVPVPQRSRGWAAPPNSRLLCSIGRCLAGAKVERSSSGELNSDIQRTTC